MSARSIIPHTNGSTITFYTSGYNNIPPTPIPAYTPLASSVPIASQHEFLLIATRIAKLYWNIHLHGLVFISPDIYDLVWAGRSDTVHLVSIGAISKATRADMNLSTSPRPSQSVLPSEPSELFGVDYRYSSPEHTGRTGNPIDQRSDIFHCFQHLFSSFIYQKYLQHRSTLICFSHGFIPFCDK